VQLQGSSAIPLDLLRRGFVWWVDELARLVPAQVRDFFTSGDATIRIALSGDDIVVSEHAQHRQRILSRMSRSDFQPGTLAAALPPPSPWSRWLPDPILLELPAHEVLQRDLTLPSGAGKDLANILRHEIERQSPIEAASVYYDYRAQRSADALLVHVRIVRRDIIDDALSFCRSEGIDPSAIVFSGDERPADGAIFPVDPKAKAHLKRSGQLTAVLVALAAVLTLCVIAATYLKKESAIDALETRVATARANASQVELLKAEIRSLEKSETLLSQQKGVPATIQVLAEVTRVLPDDTSIYELEMSQGEARIHGFTKAAASLIALLDGSPLFSHAQFRSPLMQGPRQDLERFDISFKVGAPRK